MATLDSTLYSPAGWARSLVLAPARGAGKSASHYPSLSMIAISVTSTRSRAGASFFFFGLLIFFPIAEGRAFPFGGAPPHYRLWCVGVALNGL